MKHTHRALLLLAALMIASLFPPSAARAGNPGTEIWVGSGISWPDYHDAPIACVRGGVGLVFRNIV
ncbi:MAG TPA: hypothetical protein VF247_07010, partial [Candidatus Krumholzibacteria bacterium]